MFISMFSLVYNHLKIRIMFSSDQNEPFISTKGANPLPWGSKCCSPIFLQQPRMDKSSRVFNIFHVYPISFHIHVIVLHPQKERVSRGILSHGQSVISQLDSTIFYTLDLKVNDATKEKWIEPKHSPVPLTQPLL